MIKSMMGGFYSVLDNWSVSVSPKEFAAREGSPRFEPLE